MSKEGKSEGRKGGSTLGKERRENERWRVRERACVCLCVCEDWERHIVTEIVIERERVCVCQYIKIYSIIANVLPLCQSVRQGSCFWFSE